MFCDNCKVSFESDTGCCPLCHEKIGGIKTEGRLYPPRNKMITKSQFRNFTKLYFFISLIAIVVTGIINFVALKEFTWSVVVLAGVLYFYSLIKNTILAKSNIGFKIMVQAVFMSLMLYAIDYFATDNSKWSLEIAIPFVLVATTLSLTVLAFSNFKKWRDYVLYIMATVLIGLVPFIFYLTHIIILYWPSLVSFLYSIFTILGMLMFYRNKFTNEIKKNFHI
jgi:hypothetical protein